MPENYSVVMQLGSHSDVALLREASSDRLVVRRIASAKQAQIYRRLQKLAAPHIPAVFSIEDLGDGRCEILEEHVDGRTLEEVLEEEGGIAGPLAADYVTQLCEALEALHKAGLVHRDIKPSNLMVDADGALYLIDFDIAREHKPEGGSDTEILGTQGWAAPEQFGFHQTGAQSDIYSAGILLNKLLTGKMPNEGLAKGPMAHVVRRCMQMDAARRYPNAGALKRALRPWLPKGHPKAFRFLRQIPGFRSFTGWKMALAGACYGFFALSAALAALQNPAPGAPAFLLAATSCLYDLFLFFFVFDAFQIRSRIPWLERSRGRWTYPLKCVLLAVLVLALAYAIAGWLEKNLA